MEYFHGFIDGVYMICAVVVFYVAYLIEIKLDLPGILNGARQRVDSGSNNYSDISEARLRQLISTIITETLRLPMLTSAASDLHLDHRAILPLTNGNAGEDRKSSYFETETYHDLLATAVLNRIIGKENDSRIISESTPDLRIGHKPEDLDQKYIVENQSRSTCSSVEPRSDLSYSDEDQQNNVRLIDSAYMLGRESALSDYIATHTVPLPDLSAAFTDDEDHASAGSSTLGGETWEDNWLFKKKHSSLDTSRLSTSSRMLVPAPKEDIRAQIGDQIADEVSDLSEMGSDSDDSPMDAIRKTSDPLNDRLLNKHLIGGANTKMVLDELMDASLLSKTENNKVELSVQITSQCSDTDTSKLKDNNQTVEGYPISGSIAEREYRKWNNAVEMPNNPYAPEALKRRISGSGNEPFIDLPTINSGKENNPLAFLRETQNDNADENTLLLLREQEKLRYSRDYYINNESGAQALPYSPQKTGPMENRDEPSVDNVIINEETRAMPSAKVAEAKEQIQLPSTSSGACGGVSPTRGSTPSAFKFLAPKRRLIDPSQVLSIDEEDPLPSESMVSSCDKSVIEEEIIHALPSVKALAKAFLLSTTTMPQVQRRWTSKIKSAPATPQLTSPLVPRKMLESQSFAEGTSLSTQNIPLNRNASESDAQESASGRTSPNSTRYLKSNIAFFENLKFK